MTRRKGKPRPAPVLPKRAGKRSRMPVVMALGALLLVVITVRMFTSVLHDRDERSSIVPVPLDSVAAAATVFEAATSRRDWPEALRWQERIAAALPTNSIALRQLGQVLHNHRNAITFPDGRTGWLLRNSLIRAQWEMRALALFDSSGAVTRDPQARALAHYWKGRTADYEGLPLDALFEYEAALAVIPQDSSLLRLCMNAREAIVAASIRTQDSGRQQPDR